VRESRGCVTRTSICHIGEKCARTHKHAKLLPGNTKVRGKKIHLFRMDEPRSPKAYIFGNSLAVFQSFLGHSTSGSRRNTWQALDIFTAALEETFRAPHPVVLIGAKGRRCDYHSGCNVDVAKNSLLDYLSRLSLDSISVASERRLISKSSYYMRELISCSLFCQSSEYTCKSTSKSCTTRCATPSFPLVPSFDPLQFLLVLKFLIYSPRMNFMRMHANFSRPFFTLSPLSSPPLADSGFHANIRTHGM